VRVLAVNAGSSSLKLSLVDDGVRVAHADTGDWDGTGVPGLDRILDGRAAVDRVDAVAHRVVHGGPTLTAPVRIDEGVLSAIDEASVLAPLHNPASLRAIERTSEALPQVPAVACFDTAFHAGLPAAAATYALPAEWNERWQLRRYGAHGLSHAYVVRRSAELVDRAPDSLRVVSCHLGSGASLAAVRGGRCVDTTMGLTPMEGLVMATRSGSVDPGLLLLLLQRGDTDADELAEVLEHRSGLAGLAGSSDLREVLARRDAGDAAAALAYDVYVHSIVRHIGAMAASTGGLDVLAFTGGIGEHQPPLRSDVAGRLRHLGVEIDPRRNDSVVEGPVGTDGSPVHVVVVPAGEDLQMAQEAHEVLTRE
jgi:acetate kinase